jgi:hypothetical protein
MKTKFWLGAVLVCLVALSASAAEEPVTLVGTIACAKCVLQVDGQTACQNVLVVDEEGKETRYYLEKNESYDKVGEVCKDSFQVKATGTLEEKEGLLWLTATTIQPM